MNAQRVASSPRRRGSFFPSFVPLLFLAYSTRLHAQSPRRLPLVILAGESSPDSCSIKSLRLSPCGVSFSTPHAAGCGVQADRAPGMPFLAQTTPNTAPLSLGERMSIDMRLYLFEIPSFRTLRMSIDIRWKLGPSSMYADRHSPPGPQGTPCLAVSRSGFHRFTV